MSSQRPQLLPAALQLLHPAFPLTKTPASPRCSAASASRFSARKDLSFSPLLCISLSVLVRLPMTIDRRMKITPPPSLRCTKQNGKYWRCKNWRICDNPLCQVHFQQLALLKEGKSLPPEKGENKPARKKPIVSLCSRLERRRKITPPPSLRCARQNGKHWRCKNWSLHDKPFCQVHFFQQQALLKQGKSLSSNAIAGKMRKNVTFAVELRKSGRLEHEAFSSENILIRGRASPRYSAASASRFSAHKDPSFSPLLCSFCIPFFRSGKEGERGKFRIAFSLTKTPASPRCSAASASRFSAHKDPSFSPLLCISLSVLVRIPMTIDRRRKITPPPSLRCAKQNGKYWRCKNWQIRDNHLCQVHFQQLALLKEGKSLPPEKGENKPAGKKLIVSLCRRLDRRRKITPPPSLRCGRQNGKHWRCKNWSLHDKPFCQVHFFQQQALLKQGKSLPSNAIAGKKRKKVTFAVELRKSGRLQHEAFSSDFCIPLFRSGKEGERGKFRSSQRPQLLPAALQLLHPAFPLRKGRREREVQELTKTPASPRCSAASASRFSAHKDPSFSPLLCISLSVLVRLPMTIDRRRKITPPLSLCCAKQNGKYWRCKNCRIRDNPLCQVHFQELALLKEGKSLPPEKGENKPAGKKSIVSQCSRLDRQRKITPPSLRCARQNGKKLEVQKLEKTQRPQLLPAALQLLHPTFLLTKTPSSPRCSAASTSRFFAHKDPSFSPLLCISLSVLVRLPMTIDRRRKITPPPSLRCAKQNGKYWRCKNWRIRDYPLCQVHFQQLALLKEGKSLPPEKGENKPAGKKPIVSLCSRLDRRRKITPPPSLRCARQNGKHWRCKNWSLHDKPFCQVHFFQQQALLKQGKSLPSNAIAGKMRKKVTFAVELRKSGRLEHEAFSSE
ncbi:hypothetical protein EJ110_NYTH48146 [Nymphaea thermarum]|nr:hypothetical protein EJ110_NYTH48146 [Nymphaea thermarum]